MTKTDRKIKQFYAIPYIAFIPSKIGKKVYVLHDGKITESHVHEFRLIEPYGMQISVYAENGYMHIDFDYSTFKRYCFKSKKKAEQALKNGKTGLYLNLKEEKQ